MSKRIIGSCSLCGGTVSTPTVFYSVNPPVASCEKCGATEEQKFPVVEMKSPNKIHKAPSSPLPFRGRGFGYWGSD